MHLLDKLVRALNGKFNGLKFYVWKRTAQSVISMRHAGISDILEGRPCLELELISPRPSSRRGRPSRTVTRSQAADETHTQSGETPPADTAEKCTAGRRDYSRGQPSFTFHTNELHQQLPKRHSRQQTGTGAGYVGTVKIDTSVEILLSAAVLLLTIKLQLLASYVLVKVELWVV